MKNIRIGNDIKIEWSLYDGGSAFILEGRDVKVYLKDKYGRKEITDYVISGNMLTWTFHGKNQRRTGAYSLELVVNENENGMITTDACQFVNLVHCSCDVAGSDDNGVSTETIELRSQLSVGGSSGEGGGSYDDTAIWKAVNNKVDKVVGKGLSTNDYTNAEKSKLAGLKNYDDTQIKKDIEGLSKKIEGLEPGGPGTSYDDTEIRNAITGLEQSKANKPILISIEALGTPAHLNDKDVAMYWSKEQVEAALSMTLSELYEQAQTREVIVNIMGQTLYPESTMRFEDDLIEFRYPIPTPAVSGFYVLNISRSPINVADVNTAIMLGGQFAELATKEELTELSANVAELRHDLGECDSRAGSALDMAEKHEEELTELSAEVSGLSERVEELGEGGSSVFEAVFGETPYNDILEAGKARKHVICYYRNFIYNLTQCQEGYDLKFSCADIELLTIICKVNGGWSTSNAGHESILNKVTSISSTSTNTQYPSAKAVYDFVNNTLGTIINGDY